MSELNEHCTQEAELYNSTQKVKQLFPPNPHELFVPFFCNAFFHLPLPAKQFDHTENIYNCILNSYSSMMEKDGTLTFGYSLNTSIIFLESSCLYILCQFGEETRRG